MSRTYRLYARSTSRIGLDVRKFLSSSNFQVMCRLVWIRHLPFLTCSVSGTAMATKDFKIGIYMMYRPKRDRGCVLFTSASIY